MLQDILNIAKTIKKFKFTVKHGRQILYKTKFAQQKPFLKRLILNTSRYGSRYLSIVQRMGKVLFSPATQTRPNSLIRAFNSVSTIVRFRNDPTFNDFTFSSIYNPLKSYDKLRENFVRNFRFESIRPQKYLSSGSYGAVWSGKIVADEVDDGSPSGDVALKVLYNFYAASDETSGPGDTSPDKWTLLHKQHDREVNMRPPGTHPNIVPVICEFFKPAPASDGASKGVIWEKAEQFPDGFGGQPPTWYLMMPMFDGSLEDLLEGKWKPISVFSPSVDSASSSVRECSPSKQAVPSTVATFTLPQDEAVAILTQMTEAIGHLECHRIAHRDIKPSNFLVKTLCFDDAKDTLNTSTVRAANPRLRVALTDFGCAISTAEGFRGAVLAHTGNPALCAPEVAAVFFPPPSSRPWEDASDAASLYARADLWAAATIAYQLFGLENPFLTGKLASVDYEERDLPDLAAPVVVTWAVRACLRRTPSQRPSGHLVADVLHTWSILRLLRRLIPDPKDFRKVVPRVQLPEEVYLLALSPPSEEAKKAAWLAVELAAVRFSRAAARLEGLQRQLHHLLQLTWCADWLLGGARVAMTMGGSSSNSEGWRSRFYQRVTPQRFAYCLSLVQMAEHAGALLAPTPLPLQCC